MKTDGSTNNWLIVGAGLSFLAAALHIAVIIGGPDWYRAFGAGEKLASMAERGSLLPDVLTVLIASVLFVWGVFALSGAGLIRKLPLLRLGLVTISAIYVTRGVFPFLLMPFLPEYATTFWVWSSLVCLMYGIAYGTGTYRMIQELREA